MQKSTYVHGTERSEQHRLAELNRLTNAAFIEFLQVKPGMKVLEVGSGLGLLAAAVAATAPGVEVIGVERSPEQLAAATAAPGVSFVEGDAHSLSFPDGSFDLVYCRYVLEHVGDPARVVSEMARVTRLGGRIAVQENDITLNRFDPPCPTFDRVWAAFARHQADLGGDALIGRRLYRLFHAAGLRDIRLSVQPEIHWHGSPGFRPWVVNLIGNVRSGERGLVSSGLSTAAEIDAAIGELTMLVERPDASAQFVWNRAAAIR